MRLWFDDGGAVPPEYLVELVVEGVSLHLRATAAGDATPPAVDSTDLFAKDTWVAFRIDFDMSNPNQPAIAASIDGAEALEIEDPPPLVSLAEPHYVWSRRTTSASRGPGDGQPNPPSAPCMRVESARCADR